jgi:hypothetical protein
MFSSDTSRHTSTDTTAERIEHLDLHLLALVLALMQIWDRLAWLPEELLRSRTAHAADAGRSSVVFY